MRSTRDTVRKARSATSFLFDPRLAIGVGLVIASVVGVVAVVAASDHSTLVYSAASTLTPGDRVFSKDLDVASVRLGSTHTHYLSQGDIPAEGVVVTRSVAAGELVPTTAVGAASSIRVASIVVNVGGELSQSIAPGGVVDVWSAALTDERKFGPPSVLVGSATVVRVFQSPSIINDNRGSTVELLVPRSKIARVLEALADTDAISLVPVSTPVQR